MPSNSADLHAATGIAGVCVPADLVDPHCPHCEYNLTGLPELRCPECGQAFNWEEVRRHSKDRPTILFERARTWRKIPAFIVTWVTVLLLPWVFARQITRRVNGWHAVAFLMVCYLVVSVPYAVTSFSVWLGWLSAASVCIVLESLMLTALDPNGWRQKRATFRFWLCAGCYTSAVMITEWHHAPPVLGITDLWEMAREWSAGTRTLGDILNGTPMFLRPVLFQWCQIGVWIAALACCLGARTSGAPWRRWILMPLVIVLLLVCYGFCVEFVGVKIFEMFEPSLK